MDERAITAPDTKHNTFSAGDAAVEITNLVKTYGDRRAVDDLSFKVESGKLTALLGPNGAGKTTTLEIVEGLRRQDSGKVTVLGMAPKSARARVGVQLQEDSLYSDLSSAETLRFFGRLYGCNVDADALLALVGLEKKGKQTASELSGGQRRRLQLAIALVNDPELIILDEPTTGLDPVTRRETWALISALKSHGKTILLTTHYIEEAEVLSDWVIIIDAGKVVSQGTATELVNQGDGAAHIEIDDVSADEGNELLSQVGGALTGSRWIMTAADPVAATAQVGGCVRDETRARVRIRSRTLEDVFLEKAGHGIGREDTP